MVRIVIERCWIEATRRKGAIALLLAAIAATASCNGATDDDDDDAPAGPVAVNDFSQRFAASYCGNIQSCCQQFGERFELNNCRAAVEGYLSAALAAEISNPRVVFDEQAAGRCIDGYAAALRACTERTVDTDDACDGLLRGTVAPGGACGESVECVQSADQYVSCDTGVCVAEEPYVDPFDGPVATLGEPCSGTCEGSPDDGFGCTGTSTGAAGAGVCWTSDGVVCGSAGTCVAAPQAGDPCPQYYCGVGAYCVSGTCQPASSNGPCTQDAACVPTSYCSYETMLCTPLKADGETCDSSDECLGGDCEADRCRVWSVASAESCAGLLD